MGTDKNLRKSIISLRSTFDLEENAFSGYLSDSEILDIEEENI